MVASPIVVADTDVVDAMVVVITVIFNRKLHKTLESLMGMVRKITLLAYFHSTSKTALKLGGQGINYIRNTPTDACTYCKQTDIFNEHVA